MNKLPAILPIIILLSCTKPNEKLTQLQRQVDTLKTQLSNLYKPGFGELMSSIQNHHSKLWFAGVNHNWKLADFEVHEIIELFDDIREYQGEREEIKEIDIVNPALDKIKNAINNKNLISFKNSYKQLTNSCNQCHKITKFEFNIVKIPTKQIFSNQEFKIK